MTLESGSLNSKRKVSMISVFSVAIGHPDLKNSIVKAIELAFPDASDQQMVSVASGANDRWEVEIWRSEDTSDQPHLKKILGYGEHSPKSVVRAIEQLLAGAKQ